MEDYLDFTLLETNLDREVVAVECKKEAKFSLSIPKTLLPVGIPNVLETLQDQVKSKLLNCLEDESIYSRNALPRTWTRNIDIDSLYSMDLCPLKTSIQVDRNATNGDLLGFYEAEECSDGIVMRKEPLHVRGKSNESEIDIFVEEDFPNTLQFDSGYLTCPPGFDHGMEFKPSTKEMKSRPATFNIADVAFSRQFDEQLRDGPAVNNPANNLDDFSPELPEEATLDLSKTISSSKSENSKPLIKINDEKNLSKILEEVWAKEININLSVSDFHKKIPIMAHSWPFELDTFQKHSVLKLEDHQSVFVAAHTSAGKTVVAEYAIALTAKHMTRVVYTSPIKALSNQKFRDFKQTFTDVGLITGDVQINPEAFCLIMTTEILRSMLYNGSDVIRDLEWVIFDEVHYINDAERGVVWEEVLIMLPDHCNIILLSATVPNAFEFANWIGRTKQRKIHVISTLKRPVPLEHFLYTGNSTKTSDEMFMIVDGNRKFLTGGYKRAVEAKNERMTKHSKTFGAKVRRGGGFNADKNVWLSLITRLRKLEQLPVVAFTFSRRRCDENASSLQSLDLTSQSEKREVHIFFNKCIQRLKGTDRKLPQVLQMATLLERGVAVHHSGILPILKEVVEMLFTRGLVKLLFATETFAMGVNMPARTVVFDSLRKHDGTQMRNLLPGEYIQMAGRAGRRGLDATGTVILLCKGDIPESSELHTMMLGKVTKLQSQFRLTYGMILNLLRVEQLRVEEVMKKSFSEFNTRKNSKVQEDELKKVKDELDSQSEIEQLLEKTDYEQYYLCCTKLLKLRSQIMAELLSGNSGTKIMNSGRVVVISNKEYRHHVAVALKANTGKSEKTFLVLILLGQHCGSEIDSWSRDFMLNRKLFRPDSAATQELIEVKSSEISYITNKTLRIPSDTIIADCKRRQLPRFRSDPVDQTTSVATQQLLRLVDSNPEGIPSIDVISEIGIKQVDFVEIITRIKSLETSIGECFNCVDLPRFKSQMLEVEKYLKLKEKFTNLKYLLSDESLFLLPEYQQRVKVLECLRYVDGNGAVQMKGRVACEISTHELILTELVFENILSSLDPTEIVALLSCCVFQQKVDMEEVSLTPQLKQGMNRIIEVASVIGHTQCDCGMREPVDELVCVLKFGLVEVVYEWAKGTSFKDITNLTTVQEGMIVRTIQRLNELCRDVRNAARVIGDPTLYSKMEKCSELIKRDIVFAASLYTH